MADNNYDQSLPGDTVDPNIVAVQDYYEAPTTDSEVVVSASRGWFGGGPRINPDQLEAASGRDLQISALRYGDPLGYVFGHTTVVPKIITVVADGDYLYVDYFISVGECESIVSVSRGGEDIGKPAGWEYHLGASGQAASAMLSGVLGDTYDALDGICHVVAKLSSDDPIDCRFVVKGVKLFDPRPSPQTTSYSTNVALVLARVLTDCGYTVRWTGNSSVATAANYCDEDVSGASRWTLNLQCASRQNIRTWVGALAAYGNLLIDYQGGEVLFAPDTEATTSPIYTKTVTADDIVAGSAKTSIAGTRSTPDQVTVLYKELDGTQRTAIAGTGSVGARTRLSMPGIQTYTEARRKAEEILAKAALDLRHQHITHDAALSDSLGDLMSITYAPHSLSGKVMRLVGYEEVERGRWLRKFIEYGITDNSGVYTETEVVTPNPPNPNVVPDGPTPTLEERWAFDQAGQLITKLYIEFTGVSWPYADTYLVHVYQGDALIYTIEWPHQGEGVLHAFYPGIGSMQNGSTYTVKIWVKSADGLKSENPGEASITSSTGANSEVDAGSLTNMHTYILDGDSKYATSSNGVTWANRFTDSPQGGTAWTAGETWLGNQTFETVFESAVWDSGQTWDGLWRWTDFQYVTELNGASSGDSVLIATTDSPPAFTEYTGTSYSRSGRYMKAKCVVSDSPLSAGYGLHIKLPVPVSFLLGMS